MTLYQRLQEARSEEDVKDAYIKALGLKLNRADVGWYRVRKTLKARNASGDFTPARCKSFNVAYKALLKNWRYWFMNMGF